VVTAAFNHLRSHFAAAPPAGASGASGSICPGSDRGPEPGLTTRGATCDQAQRQPHDCVQ
jgi:hypothetical protein